MAKKPLSRRGVRLSRPDSERFFTIMLVFSQRTFRWSIARRTVLWSLGIVAGIWAVAMVGSAYGLWATKKIMSFDKLQRDTWAQQQQVRDSLNQARTLDGEVRTLRRQLEDLLKVLNPRNPGPSLPPVPNTSGARPSASAGDLDRLQRDLDRTSAQAHLVRVSLDPIIDRWNHTPSILPTAGYLSSPFGIRLSPFARRNEADDGLVGFHQGVDITNSEGTPIQATADGEVLEAGPMGRYGNGVRLSHNPQLETLYAHMSRVAVKEGQQVSRGDILGYMGRTGMATGVHLHYEVHLRGRPVNPMPYMRLQREWLSSLR
jgi:murein DD-endopeptidase MepM/ murein hydrolase activator NlpD